VRVRGYIELLRPANVVTALADVLTGYALAGFQNPRALPWLLLSSACLYAGGVVLNDVFDRDLDRVERPERPIPSGRVSIANATILGSVLLAGGPVLALGATSAAVFIATTIAALVVLYDAWGKRQALGPINMGMCRALNLLLGIAAAPQAIGTRWPIALIPFAYIMGVTALSRGEVHGAPRRAATAALVSLTAALSGLVLVVVRSGEPLLSGAVLLLLAWRVVPPFLRARRMLDAVSIRGAVKAGVLSLVLVNAVLGTAYAGPAYGALILLTAIVAGVLARMFAVT
jgi:4-hydroxybenzoate polyprenyltransferase